MNIYLFNIIHNLAENNFINYLSIFISYIYVYALPIILIIWIVYRQSRKMFAFSILFLSSFFAWFLSQFIKIMTDIARPVVMNPIIIESGSSFPSQHGALTMALAVTVYSLDKKLGIFLFVMSILVGLSRVILGVHFPIDVLAGWVLGALIGFIFIKLFKKV